MFKKKTLICLVAVLLTGTYPVWADTVWDSGHHDILDGETYGEIEMYNDCTLDILGGDIYRLAAYNTTVTNWYDGQMDSLWARDDSIVNIYGGSLDILWADENSSINLFSYDVVVSSTGGIYNQGYVTGYFFPDNEPFYFDISQETYLHINVVPEPTTLLLLGMGGILFRRKR